MSKSLIGMVLVGVLLVIGFTVQPAHAASSDEVIIEGIVTNSGIPAAGRSVFVGCRSQFEVRRGAWNITDSNGRYVHHTTTDLCPIGWTAEARADKDGDGKYETSALATVSPHTTLNIELGINIAVPEFGLAGAVAATSMGVGAIVLMRRKYVGSL